jgi:pimeloyl-ACP methyl ester carboxylesterase
MKIFRKGAWRGIDD